MATSWLALLPLASLSAPNAEPTPWDVPCARPEARICPDGYQQTSRGQYKEDLWLVENYFCDICVAPKYRAPTNGIEPGQRTFVEIGALDGRMYSNTFMFERHFEFGGLLIEGHPVNRS